MSRSKRKTPITGITTAESEKQDKRRCNRILRRVARVMLRVEGEAYIDPTKHDALDLWSMSKDGKHYWGDRYPELMRK